MEVTLTGSSLRLLSIWAAVIYTINGYIVPYVSSPVHKKYITALINIFSDKGRGHLLNFLERHILESRTIVSANTGLYTDVKFVVFIFQLCSVVPLRGDRTLSS